MTLVGLHQSFPANTFHDIKSGMFVELTEAVAKVLKEEAVLPVSVRASSRMRFMA